MTSSSARRFLASSLALTLVAAVTPAAAQERYPERPIKLVVGFQAGSGADLLVRFFSDRMAAASGGATFIVENKPGALGNIAIDAVAKARPDGYTVLMGSSSGFAGNLYLVKDVPYHPVRDFAPVTTVVQLGFVLVSRRQQPREGSSPTSRNMLKAKAGKAKFGLGNTSGLASSTLYLDEAGIAAVSVPYKANSHGRFRRRRRRDRFRFCRCALRCRPGEERARSASSR